MISGYKNNKYLLKKIWKNIISYLKTDHIFTLILLYFLFL